MSSKCLLRNGQNKSALSDNPSTKVLRLWDTNEGSWEITIILPVHCKNKIKISEIWGFDRPRYWGHLYPPLLGSWYHPWVGLISLNSCDASSILMPSLNWLNVHMRKVSVEYNLMITYGTSRVYAKLGLKSALAYEVPEDGLSCRTPTNVPCTYIIH